MSLSEAVIRAQSPAVHAAVHALYDELMSEIDQRKPRCDASGRCCHFDAYGHRLYVTTAELATFLTDLGNQGPADPATPPPPSTGGRTALPVLTPQMGGSCAFLKSNLCSVHTIRPFGCRIYFCDPTATEWMESTYEVFHGRLKQLHESMGLDYWYVEWRSAMEMVRKSGSEGL